MIRYDLKRSIWVSMILLGFNVAMGQEPGKKDSPSATPSADANRAVVQSNLVFKELRKLDRKGPTPIGDYLVFSAEGRLAVSVHDRDILLSDAPTWQVLHRFSGHDGLSITALAFAPDSKRFASAGYDGRVQIWDIESRKEIARFEGHRSGKTFKSAGKDLQYNPPNRILFSPDGQQILTFSRAHAWLWDPATGKEIRRLDPKGYSFSRAVYSPDGTSIIASMYKEALEGTYHLIVWDAQTGKEVRRLAGSFNGDHWIDALAVTPSGKHLVACCRDDTIRTWEIETGKETRRLSVASKDKLTGFALSQDGRLAITWDQKLTEKWVSERVELGGGRFEVRATLKKTPAGDPTIHLWDVVAAKRLGSKTLPGRLYRAVLTPNGRQLFLSAEKQVQQWELIQGADSE